MVVLCFVSEFSKLIKVTLWPFETKILETALHFLKIDGLPSDHGDVHTSSAVRDWLYLCTDYVQWVRYWGSTHQTLFGK